MQSKPCNQNHQARTEKITFFLYFVKKKYLWKLESSAPMGIYSKLALKSLANICKLRDQKPT